MALAGAYDPNLKLFDVILANSVFSESNFALTLNNEICHVVNSSNELNNIIEEVSKEENIEIVKGNTVCTDCFDVYMTDKSKCFERMPKDIKVIGAEMEAFALFYNAKLLNKKAATILTVVDDEIHGESADSESREKALTNMIELALNTEI